MPSDVANTGLCGTCAHARPVVSGRGSAFLRCERHDLDARFPKYPPLPRLACEGFEARVSGAPTDA